VSSPVRNFGPFCEAGRNHPEEISVGLGIEATVLATQATIEGLAGRIERAYRLRRSGWYRGASGAGPWSTAAAILVQLHQEDPAVPLDPELYVAVQPADNSFDDPWEGLAQAAAGRRYRARVREMIGRLRAELRAEIRYAERRIARGEPAHKVLTSADKRLSPLGRYIVSMRADHGDLGERFRREAMAQHRSCPLYRAASLALLPADLYPARERSADDELVAMVHHVGHQVHLN
jgi:hypothetical protein